MTVEISHSEDAAIFAPVLRLLQEALNAEVFNALRVYKNNGFDRTSLQCRYLLEEGKD